MSPPSKHSLFLQRSETEGVCKISTCRIRTATEIDHLLRCFTGGSAVRSYRSASETSGTLQSDPYVLPLHFSTHILVSILLPPLLHTVSFFKTPKFFDISLKQPIVNYKITQCSYSGSPEILSPPLYAIHVIPGNKPPLPYQIE